MTDDDPASRRRFLKLAGGATALGLSALAGCTGTANHAPGGDSLTAMANRTGLPQVVGGPNDLKSDVTVKMVAMHANEGHGYAYLPSVVWLKPGGKLTWKHEKSGGSKAVSHTVTALNPANDKPQFTPNGSAAFDSGVIQDMSSASALQGQLQNHKNGERPGPGKFKNQFGGPFILKPSPPKYPKGVYFYICEDHDFLGMGGAFIVGNVGPGDSGWSPAMTKDLPFPKQLSDRFRLIREKIHKQTKS